MSLPPTSQSPPATGQPHWGLGTCCTSAYKAVHPRHCPLAWPAWPECRLHVGVWSHPSRPVVQFKVVLCLHFFSLVLAPPAELRVPEGQVLAGPVPGNGH